MFFVPNVKKKRRGQWWNVLPFLSYSSTTSQLYVGTFTGISVEVCNKYDIQALYGGFYGKGSQSRSVPNSLLQNSNDECSNVIEETLSLSLTEAFFLSYYLKVLKINDLENKELIWQDFVEVALQVNGQFMDYLASYLYLKSKGWVVKSGLKFAGDYLVYRNGPRFYHASFVVIVIPRSNCNQLRSRRLKGLQRIAETSDKDVLILDVSRPSSFQMQILEDISQFCIAETIIKRFNYTSFVQSQQNTS